ncbi:unnamed protein product, partial [Aphanomyces euteiches]
MAKGLYKALTPTSSNVVSEEVNEKAYGILIETIETEHGRGPRVQRVQAYHEPITKADRIEILKEWAKISWNPKKENLPDFINRFEILARRLTDVGMTETDDNLVVKMLALMPWSFRYIVDRLLHTASQNLATIKVPLEAEWKAALRSGEMSKIGSMFTDERALSANGSRGARQGRGQGCGRGQGRGRGVGYDNAKHNPETKKGAPHYCGKEGHWKSECRKKAAHDVKKRQERSNHANHSNDEDFMFLATYDELSSVNNHQDPLSQNVQEEFLFSALEVEHDREEGA